jgi:hypothetical protein
MRLFCSLLLFACVTAFAQPTGAAGDQPKPSTRMHEQQGQQHVVRVETIDYSCGYYDKTPIDDIQDHRGLVLRVVERAVEKGGGACVEVLKLVVQLGADPDRGIEYPFDRFNLRLHGSPLYDRVDNGTTALMHASQHGRIDLVEILLKAGARPNRSTRIGKTALMAAAEQGHVLVLRALMDAGAKLDMVASAKANAFGADYSGSALRFALNHARRSGDAAAANFILDKLRPGVLLREEIDQCLGAGPLPAGLAARVQALKA